MSLRVFRACAFVCVRAFSHAVFQGPVTRCFRCSVSGNTAGSLQLLLVLRMPLLQLLLVMFTCTGTGVCACAVPVCVLITIYGELVFLILRV